MCGNVVRPNHPGQKVARRNVVGTSSDGNDCISAQVFSWKGVTGRGGEAEASFPCPVQ